MDKERVKKLVSELLIAFDETPERPGLKGTPERVADMFEQILAGQDKDPKDILRIMHELEHDEMVIIRDIPIYSMCEHHLLPFFGKCHLAYIPDNNRIVGISKLTKVVEMLSKRLQVQEKLTTDIANAIMDSVKPKGVGVVIEARHLCMEMLGERQPGTSIVTSAVLGRFRTDLKTRDEFLKLIR